MVEEVERRTQREAIEPKAHFRQFHGHRVKIDSIDAALQNMPLEQIDVGQLVRIDRDALNAERFQNALPRDIEREVHRIDRELIEELEQSIGDEIDRLDEEVTAAHCRVEDS